MKALNILAAAIIALTITGCATGYHSTGYSGGYTDAKLSENAFSVMFSGNTHTSRERVKDFALLRACEVCLSHGFSYFEVTSDISGTGFAAGGNICPYRKVSIKSFHDNPRGGQILDAKALKKELSVKYGMAQN